MTPEEWKRRYRMHGHWASETNWVQSQDYVVDTETGKLIDISEGEPDLLIDLLNEYNVKLKAMELMIDFMPFTMEDMTNETDSGTD